MKKRVKRKKPSIKPEAGPDMMSLINKMMEHLVSLEKKIDALTSLAPLAVTRTDTATAGRRPDAIPHPPERKQDNGFRERILHKAVCAECNKECEVPFKPSGTRPVYCKECFAKRKNGASPIKEKPENRSAERVLVYERSFQKDQAAANPKSVVRKTPPVRRRR